MTPEDFDQVVEANPDADRTERCALVLIDGVWALVVGETQSDGVLRTVAMQMDFHNIGTMFSTLSGSSPEGQAAHVAMIERIKSGSALQ